MQKWTRNYFLTVQVDADAKDYIDITMPLTLSFHIQRNINATANTANITVLNLNKDTRSKVFLDNYKTMYYKGIELRAGYGDKKETLPLIFKGNIQTAFSKRNGVDYETTIQALDGGFAYINSSSSRQFPKGTTDRQALVALSSDLWSNDPKKNCHVALGKIGHFNLPITRGNTIDGNTLDYFSTYSDNHFFIDLEKINCLLDDEGFEGSIKVIDASCGLLGSPLRQESFLTFEMIFEPRLQIGQFVELKSMTEDNYNGVYKVLGIEHSGIISDAQSGQCKTKVSLNYVEGLPEYID